MQIYGLLSEFRCRKIYPMDHGISRGGEALLESDWRVDEASPNEELQGDDSVDSNNQPNAFRATTLEHARKIFESFESRDAWIDKSACLGMDPNFFFPEPGDNKQSYAAKDVCNQCPVEDECADESLKRNDKYGVAGGLSERDRRKIRKARKSGVDDQGIREIIIKARLVKASKKRTS